MLFVSMYENVIALQIIKKTYSLNHRYKSIECFDEFISCFPAAIIIWWRTNPETGADDSLRSDLKR